jgi:hypothetical protein
MPTRCEIHRPDFVAGIIVMSAAEDKELVVNVVDAKPGIGCDSGRWPPLSHEQPGIVE